jgi:hypothetical protein
VVCPTGVHRLPNPPSDLRSLNPALREVLYGE